MARTEHDYLGTMELDDGVYYGIQTIRGVGASNVTGHSIGVEVPLFLHYMAAIKKAAALANSEIGELDRRIGLAIVRACEEVMDGRYSDQFPVDMLTGGGGVSPHMNMNEVLANRANEILTGHKGSDTVHPNTHVNMGQSTNDVFPAAMHLFFHRALMDLAHETGRLREETAKKEKEFGSVVKLGRTCLQDALPLTLGQVFSAYTSLFDRQILQLQAVASECLSLPLGATAIGTGIGALPGYTQKMYLYLEKITGLSVKQSDNLFDALQNADIYTRVSCTLKSLASGISKMASDLRLMSSGPRAGLGEITLTAQLPGSSIMPGKINPVLPELMKQVYYQVCGNDVAVTMAVEDGELELNVWESLILKCISESVSLLSRGIRLFAQDCVPGITANVEVCARHASSSTAVASIVSAIFGYETGSAVAREAIDTGKTVLGVVIEKNLLDPNLARTLLDPKNMTSTEIMESNISHIRTYLKK